MITGRGRATRERRGGLTWTAVNAMLDAAKAIRDDGRLLRRSAGLPNSSKWLD
jgi:hypothetical protein